ncbi:MAG: hypothetical protein OXF74_02795 [Rhodobacteraceae bacterium]|nr:hypothetical protein [Paracoccaceae bacterium]
MIGRGSLPEELLNHLSRLSDRLGKLAEPLHARLAGGWAVHWYTAYRISGDININ